MTQVPASEPVDEQKGLRRLRAGAAVGLVGGMIGLVLPVSLNLIALYRLFGLVAISSTLVQFTAVFVLVGAIVFAVSLMIYRFGFTALRKLDRWFFVASALAIVGSVGLVLLAVSTLSALYSTPSIVQCIQAAPSSALSCLRAAQPLTAYSAALGLWLAWLGGLGIVVGLSLAGRRYLDGWLLGGGVVYALLLLVLIAPLVSILFPLGGWQYPLLTVPVLALLAPALVYRGSRGAGAEPAPSFTAHLRTDGRRTP